ncbi:MAG: hypothetical protein IIV04_00875 [Bacteroidaceae bacterium]|nr:hypothetical protein [Bacteroidaceae bacterium]
MAQEFDANKTYRIKSADGKYMTIGDTNANAYGNVYVTDLDEENGDQKFSFISSDGKWKIKSANGEYFSNAVGKGAGWNVNATTDETKAMEIIFEATANINEFYLRKDNSSYFKTDAVKDGSSPYLHVYHDANGATATFVVEEVVVKEPVTSLDAFESSKAYTITCARGAWVVDGTFKTSRDAGVSADAANANQQFAVLTLDNNDYYLYSVGGKGFVKSNGTIANAGDPIQLNDASSHATGRVQIQFKGTSTYVNMGGENQTALDGWSTVDAGNAVKFLEVAEFTDTEEALKMLAKGLLGEAVAEYDAKSAISGEGLGKFSCTLEGYETEVEEIEAYYQNIPETATKEEIFAKVTRLGEIIYAFTLNMPKAGSYIRVAYDYGGTIGTLYMQGETSQNSANKAGVKFTSETGAASIWYYDGTSLISYTKGVCIAETGNTRGLQAIGATQQVTFIACDRATGKYFVKVPDYIHANTADTEHFSDHCPNDGNRCAQHCLILEDVTELPVTVTAAGYATFFAPVAVTVPAGVTAHTVTINGEWATLSEASLEVIPANTGVVLYSETADTYNFAITEDVEAIADNALSGSAAATYYTTAGTYYALGLVDGKVGFYKDAFNNSRFQNNSHKAYLYVPAANGAASYSFRFEGEGTTAIEEVKTENGEVKAIFDLTGRRVEEITAPGIYIVNGKKVLVK